MRESLLHTNQQAERLLSPRAVERYIERMSQIFRWGHIKGVRPRFEHDWEHVTDMFASYDTFTTEIPQITKYFNETSVLHMMWIHDYPEIFVGDLSHQDPDYEAKKAEHKARELHTLNLTIAILPMEYRELGLYARNLYLRFERHEEGDPEASLAKYFDYEQAIIKGKKHDLLHLLNHGTNQKTVNLARQFIATLPNSGIQYQAKDFFATRLSSAISPDVGF